MNSQEFREFGIAAVDFIANYMETIETRSVVSTVKPGYLHKLIPEKVPEKGESWQEVLQDVERVIMPGITHWQSPNFHAYYPTYNSFPSIVGEFLSAGIGCTGLSWISSPAYTELEASMMDWLAKLINLPEIFLNSSKGPGGGVIQSSASETTLIALLAAKHKMTYEIRKKHPELTEAAIKGRLVAYTSNQSNSSVEKAGILGSMTMRLLPADDHGQLRGETLLKAVLEDETNGLFPCYLVATLGTTSICAFDNLEKLGPICQNHNIWLHVDAAYAGSAFACPEYRHLMNGVEFAASFNFNPHKWMLVNIDCSAMWLQDVTFLVDNFNVERIYLEELGEEDKTMAPEYRHWGLPLGRKFRALKLWFVLRMYGVEGIQKHIRKQIGLAQGFEKLVRSDPRFEVFSSSLGLVCFRLQGDDCLTVELMERVSQRKKIFVSAGEIGQYHLVRFCICGERTEKRHVEFAWHEFRTQADEVLFGRTATRRRSLKEVGDMFKEIPRVVMIACGETCEECRDDHFHLCDSFYRQSV